MRMYTELAEWWPLLSPPSEYGEEAAHLLGLLDAGGSDLSLLELGCGGGSLASHLASHVRLTLTDISAPMLAVARTNVPGAEFIQGDMRTLRLGRRFDRVLIHDAIGFLTTEEDLRAALETAAAHCGPGGRVIVLPDNVTETYEPGTTSGGHDGADGRGLRFLEWHWDPDPSDTTVQAAYAFLLRAADGSVTIDHDSCEFGLFPRSTWLHTFARAGLHAEAVEDPWRKDVFVSQPR